MTYNDADSRLTGRCKDSRKIANNTYLVRDGERIHLQLHSTDVLTWYRDGRVQLRTGGWYTPTTKDRINGYSPRYVPRVYSKRRREWAMTGADGQEYDFVDGMIVHPDGRIEGAEPLPVRKLKPHTDGEYTTCECQARVLRKGLAQHRKGKWHAEDLQTRAELVGMRECGWRDFNGLEIAKYYKLHYPEHQAFMAAPEWALNGKPNPFTPEQAEEVELLRKGGEVSGSRNGHWYYRQSKTGLERPEWLNVVKGCFEAGRLTDEAQALILMKGLAA